MKRISQRFLIQHPPADLFITVTVITWCGVDEKDFTETPDNLHGFKQFNLVAVVLPVPIFNSFT